MNFDDPTRRMSNNSITTEYWVQQHRPQGWLDWARKESEHIVKRRVVELKKEQPGQVFRSISREILITERVL